MFGIRRLKAEVVRLTYRVKELEERLCPCEQHDWVVTHIEHSTITCTGLDFYTIYHCKCKNCGKQAEKRGWEI